MRRLGNIGAQLDDRKKERVQVLTLCPQALYQVDESSEYGTSEHVVFFRLLPKQGQVLNQTAYIRPYLDVYSLDNTGDDMEHLHFSVTLCHLLQQLEEQPKDRLEVWEELFRPELKVINSELQSCCCLNPYHQVRILHETEDDLVE